MRKPRLFVYSFAFAPLVATGFLMNSDQAYAQQADEPMPEIIAVEAPIERQQVGTRDSTGMTTELIVLKRQVSFADLDLKKHEDVVELENRIETIAKEACDKLDELYPLPSAGLAERRRCTMRAIESAEASMEAAIAAAQ